MSQSWNDARRDRIARDRAAHQARIQAARARRPVPDDDDAAEAHPRSAAPIRPGLLRYDRVPVCAVGFVVLALWWAVGGRYTIDGAPLLVNVIFRFFRITARLGGITDPIWYLRLCWVPLLISIIERKNRPRKGMAWNVALVYAVVIWFLVAGVDFLSTYLAITTPDPASWPIAQQVARIPALATLWSVATTFAPEIGFAALWRYMRG